MKVVIVGGGIAGVSAAIELINKPGFEVWLICSTDIVAVSGISLHQAIQTEQYSLQDIFGKASNVHIVSDEVAALNTRVKAIKTASSAIYPYDKLLLCMEHDTEGLDVLPGAQQYAHHTYDPDGARRLRTALSELFRIAHRNEVSVLVIGAGPTGVELAGSLQAYARDIADRYNIRPKHVRVELIEQAHRVLPRMDERISRKVQKRLEKLGVHMRLGAMVNSCTQNVIAIGTEERAADVIIWAGGSTLPKLYAKYPEVFVQEPGGVVVDNMLRVPKAEDVYVLSGNTLVGSEVTLSAKLYVARYILKQLRAGREIQFHRPNSWFVIPVGNKWSLALKGRKIRTGRIGSAIYSRILSKSVAYFKRLSTSGSR